MRNDADLNNGWRTNYPEYDGTYLVVLDYGTATTMMYECWEEQWKEISNDCVFYWQPFPEPPKTCVSNCTRSKNEQFEKIPEEIREIIQKQLILMRGRVTEYQIDDLLSGKTLKINSNERVKVTAEWTDGQIIEGMFAYYGSGKDE